MSTIVTLAFFLVSLAPVAVYAQGSAVDSAAGVVVDLLPLMALADALDNGVVLTLRRETLMWPDRRRESGAGASFDTTANPQIENDGARRAGDDQRGSALISQTDAVRVARAWHWRQSALTPVRAWANGFLEPGMVRIEDRLSIQYSSLTRSYVLRFERVAVEQASPVRSRMRHDTLPRDHVAESEDPHDAATIRRYPVLRDASSAPSAMLRQAVFNDLVAALIQAERWLMAPAFPRADEPLIGPVAAAAVRVRFDVQALPLPLQWGEAVRGLPPLGGRAGEPWQIIRP
ncbi:MAG: hypothetical protein ACK4IT_02895 [Thioalkalivibrionaceae bacterium]